MVQPNPFRRPRAALLVLALLLFLAACWAGAVWLIEAGGVRWLVQANRWLASNVIERMGYAGVFLLMFIESSFVPFPSEIIMPPAGELAARLPGWSLGGVISAGVAGSLAGGLCNYFLARYLGRPAVMALVGRYGAFFRITMEGYLAAEGFFLRHGAFSTFAGRLLPGIRQVISLPAGLARMNLGIFIFFTTAGAAIWVVLLALVGYGFGADPQGMAQAIEGRSRILALAAVVLVAGYLGWQKIHRRPRRDGAAKMPGPE